MAGYLDPVSGQWVTTDLDPYKAAFDPNGNPQPATPVTALPGMARDATRGFGASAAVPMRGPRPNFPMPNLNPIMPANGPGAPTNLWNQRPSGQPGNGAPALGDVDTPGGGYGGGAPSGPLQYGPGRSPTGPTLASGPGGIGSDANIPLAARIPPPAPDGSSPAAGGAPTPAAGGSGGGFWNWLKNQGQVISDYNTGANNSDSALPKNDPNNPAPTLMDNGSGSSGPNIPIGGGPGNVMQSPTGTPGGGGSRGGGGSSRGGGRSSGGGRSGGTAPRIAPPPGAAPIQPNPGWGMIDRPNASASGGARGNMGDPKMGAFDLSTLFNHPAVAAAAAAHPNVQAHVAARIAAPAPRVPRAPPGPLAPNALPGPVDPSIIARQKMQPRTPADYGDQSWLYGNQPPM